MKSIFRDYGTALIAGSIALAVFTILFQTIRSKSGAHGLLNILGENSVIQTMDAKVYQDGVTTKEILTREKPNISYCNHEIEGGNFVLKSGEVINLCTYFCALDTDHHEIDVQVLDVLCEDNHQMIEVVDQKTCIFPKAGIYAVTVCATDSEGVTSTVTIQIPVNRKSKEEQISEAGSMVHRSRSMCDFCYHYFVNQLWAIS